MTRWIGALTLVLACPTLAFADVASPDRALCTQFAQEQDGSQCMTCQYERANEEQQAQNCAAAIERGYTERCAFGGMWVSAVYCDREANFIDVAYGRSPRAPAGGTPSEPSPTEPARPPSAPGDTEPAEADPTEAEPTEAEPTEEEPEESDSADEPEPAATTENQPNVGSRNASEEDSIFGCSVGHGAGEGGPLALLPLAALVLRRRRRGSQPPAP